MKRFTFLIFSFSILFFFFPISASAGSCKCTTNIQLDSGPTSCYNKSINIEADCTGTKTDLVQMPVAGFQNVTYANCIYCSTNICSPSSCEDFGLTNSYLPCVTAADCKQPGGPKCLNGTCYYNPNAPAPGPDPNATGILGIGEQAKIANPSLEIKIPGLNFKPIDKTVDSEGYIHLTSLAEYLSAVYKFAIAAASIIAAIMIVVNGLRITMSAGGDQKNVGIQHISQAVIGLIILWSSYALFYTINPELVQFKALKVRFIYPIADEEEQNLTMGVALPSENNIAQVIGDNLTANTGVRVESTEVLPAIKAAAIALKNQDIVLYIGSGIRSVDEQLALIAKNCQNPPGSTTCNPKPGRPYTCTMPNNDPKYCPHTTARAVDVWGKKNNAQCVQQKNCTSDPATDPCRADPCQAAVIQAMKDAGFCSLNIEAWHFELPAMSSGCTK